MPRTRAPRNFEVIGLRRRGFETTRSPSTAIVTAQGRLAAVIDSGAPLPAPGLSPTPESTGGTIIFDTRAGGINSTQGSDVSTIANWRTKYTPSGPYAGMPLWNSQDQVVSQTVAVDEVGSGIKTRKVIYTASTAEHSAPLGWEGDGRTIAPASGWYTSGKFWIPANLRLGGVNPHWKCFIWNRPGNASGRLYLGFYGADSMVVLIDERNFRRAFVAAGAPQGSAINLRDQIVQWTAQFVPTTNTVRLWIKAPGVTGGEVECTINASESSPGSIDMNPAVGLGGFQDNVTLYLDGLGQYALHTWDVVAWHT